MRGEGEGEGEEVDIRVASRDNRTREPNTVHLSPNLPHYRKRERSIALLEVE